MPPYFFSGIETGMIKLATPLYFFRDWKLHYKNWQRLCIFFKDWNGNASPAQWLQIPSCFPGPMATDAILSRKGWTNVPLAVAPMSTVGQHENYTRPHWKNFRFTFLSSGIALDLHIRLHVFISSDYWCHLGCKTHMDAIRASADMIWPTT